MKTSTQQKRGSLRIGDQWNAISILARSQHNPLKAVAELVENSIDAGGTEIRIVRGKQSGLAYLKISDNGCGIQPNEEGIPDFKYVATHICDSMKSKLAKNERRHIQGEFGIGLLSFWILGKKLYMVSTGKDNKMYEMTMMENSNVYTIAKKRSTVALPGVTLTVVDLHTEIQGMLTGEKMQRYLAAELRDRLNQNHVNLIIHDKIARKELRVQPKTFEGIPIRKFDSIETHLGTIRMELYFSFGSKGEIPKVSILRNGTRIKTNITDIDVFNKAPWTENCLEGIIDFPCFNLTPGTRDGIIYDENFSIFVEAIKKTEDSLQQMIDQHKKQEEERANKLIIKDIKRAVINAFDDLPIEDYVFFDIRKNKEVRQQPGEQPTHPAGQVPICDEDLSILQKTVQEQRRFFEFPGPLAKLQVYPKVVKMLPHSERKLTARPTDRKNCPIDTSIEINWKIIQGQGYLDLREGFSITFHSGEEIGQTIILVSAKQADTTVELKVYIQICDQLPRQQKDTVNISTHGLPHYELSYHPEQLWRSIYNRKDNAITINSGHRDYQLTRESSKNLRRYIGKLYAKELVLMNFQGSPSDEVLERLIELLLRIEQKL